MTQIVERERVEQRPPILPPTPPPTNRRLVRWIEWLGTIGLVALLGFGIWMIWGQERPDTSFEVAEQLRFERILGAVPADSFEMAEQMRFDRIRSAVPMDSWEMAEQMRFERMAPTLDVEAGSGFVPGSLYLVIEPRTTFVGESHG